MLLALLAAVARAADAPAHIAGQPIGHWIEPSWSAISREARIFLVAGSRDIANFAQEVIDQKRFWQQRGYAPEQIECFFAAPDPSHRVDVEQFLALEEELKACHLASPGLVLAAIREVAADYPEDFFYLYVTSHGSFPVLEWPENVQRSVDPQQAWLPAAIAEARSDPSSEAFAWLGSYRIEMEAMRRPDGAWGWISFLDRYVNLHRRNGARAEEELLTPATLAAALSAFPGQVRKIVILQGCHSGGFLLGPEEAPAPEATLVNVERITVLTAARADRTSFGCAGGDRTTYYGGALQRVLNGLPKKPIPRQDWRRVHRDVVREVELLENASGIPAERRSLPQYFSNHDARGRKRGAGGGTSRAAR
nr:MAG: hypothetical protein DIU62_15475 [Pseudomonadota bacterium]